MNPWRSALVIVFSCALSTGLAAAVVVDELKADTGQVEGTMTLTWYARSGQTYFILTTEDLEAWTSLPVVEVGANAMIEYTIQIPANFTKGFWRLAVTDQVAADPYAMDFDGDGIPTAWELQHGFNPLFAGDAWGDPDGDELTNLAEFRLGLNPRDAATARTPAQMNFTLYSP
ncbi:MAG: hypothetical protein Q8M02_08560 [Candidatus Didemnitutus sp.]|nr:hypothetical protein [Candidatus Didemnitutus sp.]